MSLWRYNRRLKEFFARCAMKKVLAASFVFFFLKGLLWLALLGTAVFNFA